MTVSFLLQLKNGRGNETKVNVNGWDWEPERRGLRPAEGDSGKSHQIRSTKFEIRNKFKIQMFKI